ncbi:MAG: LysR family transcriptional regulator [Alphaproteobacteria bacterium]|nr:LysR family transcriptional regulator [Alphaproteobacteria bacterium]
MDITLARTFISICNVGNFVKAAEQLYVTQSTVSARMKLLEDLLGQPLFVRTKAGAFLTPAGDQFRPFAEKLVQTWEHARQEVGLPDEFTSLLTIGAEFTLWERLLVHWIPWIRNAIPDLAVRAEVGSSADLMRQLVDGLLELVVTYTPQQRSGLIIEELMEEELVFVSSDPTTKGPWEKNYIYVDWGPEFRIEHMDAFPSQDTAIVAVNYGPLALQHMVLNDGSAYLPMRIVRPRINDGTLHLISKMPVFSRPAYVVYIQTEDDTRFETAIQGLRYVSSLESER